MAGIEFVSFSFLCFHALATRDIIWWEHIYFAREIFQSLLGLIKHIVVFRIYNSGRAWASELIPAEDTTGREFNSLLIT